MSAGRCEGGVLVFWPSGNPVGGGISVYFASYMGDQGRIAAYFFQILVIGVYAALSITLVILDWLLDPQGSRRPESSRH